MARPKFLLLPNNGDPCYVDVYKLDDAAAALEISPRTPKVLSGT